MDILRPDTHGDKIHCCKRRPCRIVLLIIVALLMLTSCLAFPVIITYLALTRLFGNRVKVCPFYMHHALCNWPRLHAGSAGPLPELSISEGNVLWIDPNISESQDAMSEAVRALQKAKPEELHQEFCGFLETWLPKVGFNGLIALLRALEVIREAETEDDKDVDAWNIPLDDFQSDLIEISEDWKHDLGAYIMARLQVHPVVPLSTWLAVALSPDLPSYASNF